MTTYRTFGYSENNLSVFPIGLGCMGMSEFYGKPNITEATKTIHMAKDLGVNLFDTSDMYGFGENEKLLANFIKEHKREEIYISTKGGVGRKKEDPSARLICGTPSNIKKSCDESLTRLGVNYIDLYFLQRLDPKTPIEESMGALVDLLKEGKIKHIGLSEVDPDIIKTANKIHPITSVQSEFSLCTKNVETNGVLDVCKELRIGFMASVPLCRGLLTGKIKTNNFPSDDIRNKMPRFQGNNLKINLKLVEQIEKMALEKSCSPGQLAIAWLMHKYENLVPIPGTKHPSYLQENINAINMFTKLTNEDIEYLDRISTDNAPSGGRGTASAMQTYGFK